MKKSIIKSILGIATVMSLILACSEADTAFNQLLWTGSWAGICFLCGRGFSKYMTEEEKEERV